MTNTKFRKRALLSSVAMLLVALVALGSATFAWFSASPTAYANGVTAGTNRSSSLVIKENWSEGANHEWVSSFTFGNTTMNNTTLDPVTFNGSTWQTGTTDQLNRGYQVGSLTPASDAYSAHSTVYMKWGNPAADGETAKTATISATIALPAGFSQDAANYLRIAFIPKAVGGNVTGTIANGNKFWGNAADDRASNPTSYTASDSAYASLVNTGTTSGGTTTYGNTFDLGATFEQGVVYCYDVYAYYEGTDAQCIDNNSGLKIEGINFTFNAAENA